ncbi:MAG: PilZ domain-containing protein [Thiohalophilus sp.]|uniref:PilZ domain-containing protein n=1 Tax=Thiohalophilus sp. TaxID=3028392 RepID=UPI00286FEB7F|nr:PilZ domain-containing protein [Thiohalophilus sp.]MDR9436440.1 PilZ domain-containing protein [Thiohalophilus sp.]
MQERRYYKRKLVNARVRLYHANFDVVEGSTRDISDGGVFVVTDHPLPLQEGEQVKMILPQSRSPDIIFNMQVIRVDADGMGLMFLDYESQGRRGTMAELRNNLKKKK